MARKDDRKVGAVLLAAGTGIPQQEMESLLSMRRPTLFEQMVQTARSAGIRDLILESEPGEDACTRKLVRFGLTFIERTDADAYRTGLKYLSGSCDRILLWPVDIPFVLPETIRKILSAPGEVSVPVYEGKRGRIAGMDVGTAKRVLAGEPVRVSEWKCEDAYVTRMVSTREAYEKMREAQDKFEIHTDLKVRLVGRKPFFGPGTMTLLTQIDRLGSVREACDKTGISYSKGRSMIHMAEEGCGLKLVERSSGGKYGGEAVLTPKCRKLMDAYHTYVKRLEGTGEALYRELFIDSDVLSSEGEGREG